MTIAALQEAIAFGLMGCSLFDRFNVVLEKRLLTSAEVNYAQLWTTSRGGCSGTGILVEMPLLRTSSPNSRSRELVASLVIVQDRELAMISDVGAGVEAEEIAEKALEFLQGWIIGLAGGLKPERDSMEPAREYTGLVAYRVSVGLNRARPVLQRTQRPVLTAASLTVTLTNGAETPAAGIWYTLDGNFPGPANQLDAGNSPSTTAQVYSTPFAVASGTTVKWCAYAADRLPSDMGEQTIT